MQKFQVCSFDIYLVIQNYFCWPCIHIAFLIFTDQCEAQKKLFWQNYFFHCEVEREKRQQEIDEECTRKASRDEELDAVIIGTSKTTAFYPSRAKLNNVTPDRTQIKPLQMSEDCDDFVIVKNSDYDVWYYGGDWEKNKYINSY